ncbi:MAG TPA: adenylate/guanylate cyclase domain-containing protein [Candidatus Entotheonella sp.]
MAAASPARRLLLPQSVSFKNILLFLFILLAALIPLAMNYYQDSRDYEIEVLASKLEFFAERGASWIDVAALSLLTQPEHMRTLDYGKLVQTLNRIEREFGVDNAIVMRRQPDGQYIYIASGTGTSGASGSSAATVRNPCHASGATDSPVQNPCHPTQLRSPSVNNPCHPAHAKNTTVSNPCNPALLANPAVRNPCHPALLTGTAVSHPCNPATHAASGFPLGVPVHIHPLFPGTYKATEDTWQQGEMMYSQLFGGQTDDGQEYSQFLQINTPLKLDNKVVAILMLNKFAKPVYDAVRSKTIWVGSLTMAILVIGLALFGYISARILRPLKNLTTAASEVAQGNLDVSIPTPRSRDEVGRLASTFNTMLEGLRQRDFIRDTFGRYLSKEVVEEVLGSPDGLKLGGETREVTFLVSDLRGFTSLSSRLPAHEVIDILNRYLERMVDIIATYRGTVDEFQGDGILAFFGAPLAAEDDQERAVACAITMQAALIEINAEQRWRGLPELNMGIGINTGEAIVGNIGSERRTKYGAVGSAINEAYRIESFTVGGQILISPSVYERVQPLLDIESTQDVQFKGLDHPVTLYNVVGLRGTYAVTLPDKTPDVLVALDPPLAISCFPIEGKTVSSHAIPGTLTHLAETAAEALLSGRVMLHSNIRLDLVLPDASILSDIYAKVVALYPDDTTLTQVRLGFTSVPEPAKAFLARQRTAALPSTLSSTS